MLEPATLPTLLWSVLAELGRKYMQHGAGSRAMPSLDLWANLVWVLDKTGTDPKALPSILCLSTRALRTRLATATRHGWTQEDRNTRNGVRVRLTVRGSEIAEQWRSLQKAGEGQWRTEVGLNTAEQLREALIRIVTAIPLEHPHCPASYGPADASITGGNGADWEPVPRTDRNAVAGLPVYALLSQLIVAFAIEYEKMSPVALSLSAEIIHRIPAEGCSVRELRNTVGVSGFTRHGFVSVRGSRVSGTAFLTPKGSAVREQYDQRVAAVERGWCRQFGNDSIAALRRSLEAVASADRNFDRSPGA